MKYFGYGVAFAAPLGVRFLWMAITIGNSTDTADQYVPIFVVSNAVFPLILFGLPWYLSSRLPVMLSGNELTALARVLGPYILVVFGVLPVAICLHVLTSFSPFFGASIMLSAIAAGLFQGVINQCLLVARSCGFSSIWKFIFFGTALEVFFAVAFYTLGLDAIWLTSAIALECLALLLFLVAYASYSTTECVVTLREAFVNIKWKSLGSSQVYFEALRHTTHNISNIIRENSDVFILSLLSYTGGSALLVCSNALKAVPSFLGSFLTVFFGTRHSNMWNLFRLRIVAVFLLLGIVCGSGSLFLQIIFFSDTTSPISETFIRGACIGVSGVLGLISFDEVRRNHEPLSVFFVSGLVIFSATLSVLIIWLGFSPTTIFISLIVFTMIGLRTRICT